MKVIKILLFTALSILFFTITACSDNNPEPEPGQTTFRLMLLSEGEGTLESDKTDYPAGESVSVTAVPADGYYFGGWYEGVTLVSAVATYTFPMPEKDLTLRALFTATEPEQTTYLITLTYEGEGTVLSEKTEYLTGESVSVTATPDQGYNFSAWYKGEENVSADAVYTFPMPGRDMTLRAVFTPTTPEHPTEGTLDMTQTITSQILGGQQSYTVYLPQSYNTSPDREYPILYLLHGLGQNYGSWENDGNMKAIADAEMSSGRSAEMIIVSPEAYGTFYVNGYTQGMNYENYFVNEFIPAIESAYRVNSTKGGRSISGLSMGGYGCAYHAFSRPEMFSSCFAMSAAFTVAGSNRPPIAPLVTARTEAELADFPAFVMECGTDDFGAYPMNNNLNHILNETSLVYTYTTRPGRHDWVFWQECLPKALKLASDYFEE